MSFDFHIEAIALLFIVLLVRDLNSGRRRAWVWVLPLLLCGDVAGTYLAGAGIGGLANRRSRRSGLVMACLGLAAVLTIALLHANRGSGRGFVAYEYLTAVAPGSAPLGLTALARGVASHPATVIRTMWDKRGDVLANLAPTGFLGVASLMILPLVLVVVLANTLYEGWQFTEPTFQYLPVYVLLPVGSVLMLSRLIGRYRKVALMLCCILVAQSLGWMAVWGPRTAEQWLRVSGPAAATLASVESRIPASAEVIASEGIVGPFSDRVHVWGLFQPGPLPVTHDTWFVLSPTQGVEIQSIAESMALIQELAGPLHAILVAHANGIWAFRWQPPAGVLKIDIPDGSRAYLAAWASPTAPRTASRVVIAGPPGSWHVASTGKPGYVDDGLAWRVPTANYAVTVRLSASGPVNVEIWDDNNHRLLTRRSLPRTTGIESVTLPVDAAANYIEPIYRGWGPFTAHFAPAPPGQLLEARVWSPGNESVNVYGAQLSNAN